MDLLLLAFISSIIIALIALTVMTVNQFRATSANHISGTIITKSYRGPDFTKIIPGVERWNLHVVSDAGICSVVPVNKNTWDRTSLGSAYGGHWAKDLVN